FGLILLYSRRFKLLFRFCPSIRRKNSAPLALCSISKDNVNGVVCAGGVQFTLFNRISLPLMNPSLESPSDSLYDSPLPLDSLPDVYQILHLLCKVTSNIFRQH